MSPTAPTLRVTYRLTCADGEDPRAKAEDIALEQTVELPADRLPAPIARRVVGKVELVEEGSAGSLAVITYDSDAVVDDLPQLVNVLFGNISMKTGIRLEAIAFEPSPPAWIPGPRFGVAGLRALADVPRRPLLCAALKPLGLSTKALAARCSTLARGGIDIIKDDHGLTNQPSAPYADRVFECAEAVAKANAATGGRTIYCPNVNAAPAVTAERAQLAVAAGCRAVLITPLLVGLATVRQLAQDTGLALLAHPALAGAFFHDAHGIAPELLLGRLFRAAGCDAVVYPNVGGRFALSAGACTGINARLREPWGSLRPAFPVPAGGIDMSAIPRWIPRYGPDTIFLLGSSLYQQRDVERAARQLKESIQASER